jgi:hypothetical protein
VSTADDLARKRAALSVAKQALIDRRLVGKRVGAPEAIPHCPGDEAEQASFAQERLWVLEGLASPSPAYHVGGAARLIGRLDVEALARTFEAIVRRREILRTTFSMLDGRLLRVVQPACNFAMPVRDLTDLPPRTRETALRQHALDEVEWPFDLQRGPVFRAALFRVDDDVHVVVMAAHHAVFDGWSLRMLLHEVARIYPSIAAKREVPLPPLPIQFRDFTRWQRERSRGAAFEARLAYWTTQLRDAPGQLGFPTDRARGAAPDFRGGLVIQRLTPTLVAALRTLSGQHGATVFMTVLSAFLAMLHRYTGQTDLVIGTPIANRDRPETRMLIGPLINMLALRADLGGDPPFTDLVARVRDLTAAAYAHGDVPFERVVQSLPAQRSSSRSPIFQTMFAYQPVAMPSIDIPALRIERYPLGTRVSKLDLTVSLEDGRRSSTLLGEYSAALFDAATIARVLGHFRRLLEAVVADPQRRIGALPLLDERERALVVAGWNASGVARPEAVTVHALVEAQAARTPTAVAVTSGAERWTYQELDERAERLAAHLRRLGVRPETRVAVSVTRGPALVATLLGILKAGGAYVPLDPAFPITRRRVMREIAGATLIVGDAECPPELLDDDTRLVRVGDGDGETPAGERRDGVSGDNLAYLLFTSGSTGTRPFRSRVYATRRPSSRPA